MDNIKENPQDTKNLVLRGETWHLCAMINGVTVRKSLRTKELSVARVKRDAILLPMRAHTDERQMLTSVRRQLEGISAEDERRQLEEQKGLPLSKAWDVFRKDPTRRQCKDEQMRNHHSHWNKFLSWIHANHPTVIYCKDLTRRMCLEFASNLLENVKATNTYNHYLSSIRYIVSSVCTMEEIRNPMNGIHSRKDSDSVSKEPFETNELERIFASRDTEFVRLCAVGLYTTLRLDSARKLKWEMFDNSLSYLYAKHDKTDTDASQSVAQELREILSAVPEEFRHGYVCPTFATSNKAATLVQQRLECLGIQTHREMDGLNGKVRRACIKGFHSFRHTAITLALQNGATVSQVKRLAGHASERMQERYTHLGADDAGKASAAIGKFW